MVRGKAIDGELRLSHEYQLPNLPVEGPRKRVEEFIDSQLGNLILVGMVKNFSNTPHRSAPLVF